MFVRNLLYLLLKINKRHNCCHSFELRIIQTDHFCCISILKPKFEAVLSALDTEIAPLGIAQWHRPTGGYFISLNAMPGTAKRTLALCKEAGVTMTSAGATFPYGKDPQDSNIRIAPSLPPVEELEQAIAVLCVCLKLAALEKLGV